MAHRAIVAIAPGTHSNCEQVRPAFNADGLLVELSPELRLCADARVHLEDVEASIARAGGEPLSEIVLEQEGPKKVGLLP